MYTYHTKLFANCEHRSCIKTPAYKKKSLRPAVPSKRPETSGDGVTEQNRERKSLLRERIKEIQKLLKTPDSPIAPGLIPVSDLDASGKLRHDFLERKSLEVQREALLDILKHSQEKTNRSHKWGKRNPKRNFSSAAGHKIRQSGNAMDFKNPGTTWMVTTTIPGSTAAALETVANWSGWIVNRMLQIFRDKNLTESLLWFYVWEFQPRLEYQAKNALHMHWAVSHPDSKISKQVAEWLEYKWFELLLELKEKTGVDCFEKHEELGGGTHRNNPLVWQSNVQKVQKSVGAYYSKYCSKDSTNQALLKRCNPDQVYYPARWWGSSKAMKQEVKSWFRERKVENLTYEEALLVDKWVWELAQLAGLKERSERNFCIQAEGFPIPFCSGKLYIAFGEQKEWPEIHERVASLFEKTIINGVKTSVVDELVKEAKKQTENLSPFHTHPLTPTRSSAGGNPPLEDVA